MKKLFVCILSVFILFGITGCGSNSSTGSSISGDTLNYKSKMESNGFTIEDISEDGSTALRASNAAKNYNSSIVYNTDENAAGLLYSQLWIELENMLTEDSAWVPSVEVNESNSKYIASSDNYYLMLYNKNNIVCYILVPIADKEIAKSIMSELGF